MSNLSSSLEKLFKKVKDHPEGIRYLTQPDIVKAKIEKWEHTFQFELDDDKPFYLEIAQGEIRAVQGVSSLDGRGKDWNKISRIWTDGKTLKGIITGEKNLMDEWHKGKLEFGSRIANTYYHSWFCILFRLAMEQLEKELVKSFLSKGIDANLSSSLEKLFKKVKDHPEGIRYLTQPDIVKAKIEKWEHTFQFELDDDKPFYLEIAQGEIRAVQGVSSLDGRGKDWNKISRIWTDGKTLKGIITGEKNLMDEWHKGKLEFGSRIANTYYHSWFCIMMRMAREQLGKELIREYFS